MERRLLPSRRKKKKRIFFSGLYISKLCATSDTTNTPLSPAVSPSSSSVLARLNSSEERARGGFNVDENKRSILYIPQLCVLCFFFHSPIPRSVPCRLDLFLSLYLYKDRIHACRDTQHETICLKWKGHIILFLNSGDGAEYI